MVERVTVNRDSPPRVFPCPAASGGGVAAVRTRELDEVDDKSVDLFLGCETLSKGATGLSNFELVSG